MYSDGKQLQELLDQVRQRATAAEEALEAAEERSEKYRSMIDEANIELNQFKEKVCPWTTVRPALTVVPLLEHKFRNIKHKVKSNYHRQLASNCALKWKK